MLKITCLYGGCPSVFRDMDVMNYVNPEIYKKYKKFKNEQLKLSEPNTNYIYCPYVNCDQLVVFDPNNISNYTACDRGHEFCMKCMKDVHTGSCSNVRLIFILLN